MSWVRRLLSSKKCHGHGLRKTLECHDSVSGRLHGGWASINGLEIIVHNLHAAPAAQDILLEENENLMNELMRRIEMAPFRNQMLLGDFQRPVGGIMQMQILAHLGWVVSSDWPGIAGIHTKFPLLVNLDNSTGRWSVLLLLVFCLVSSCLRREAYQLIVHSQ